MAHTGFVRLHRRMLDCSWYRDPAAKAVYIYLLLTARYKPGVCRDIPLQAGQTVTSMREIAAALALPVPAVRTALVRLRDSGAVTLERRAGCSVYTLAGYGAPGGSPPPAAACQAPAGAKPPCAAAGPAHDPAGPPAQNLPAGDAAQASPARPARPAPRAAAPCPRRGVPDAAQVDAQFRRVLAAFAETQGG